jgi:hypothetical protein
MPDMLIVAAAMPTLMVTLKRTFVHGHEMARDLFADSLGHDLGLSHVGFRQQHRELFAAEPADNIGGALAEQAAATAIMASSPTAWP